VDHRGVVIVVGLVVYVYRQEIGLKLKGWGVEAALSAKSGADIGRDPQSGRNVSIGGEAKDNRVMTGDSKAGKEPAANGGRNVSIGGRAEGNTIVTGDGNGRRATF
jgi:hypothetical protein